MSLLCLGDAETNTIPLLPHSRRQRVVELGLTKSLLDLPPPFSKAAHLLAAAESQTTSATHHNAPSAARTLELHRHLVDRASAHGVWSVFRIFEWHLCLTATLTVSGPHSARHAR